MLNVNFTISNCLDLSFFILMIYMLRFGNIQEKEGPWRQAGAQIKGIRWANQPGAVTHGISIWKQPFHIRTKSGQEVCTVKVFRFKIELGLC